MEAAYWFSLYAHMMILLAVLLGAVLAVPAGLASGIIARRQGHPLWYGGMAALYSTFAFLPWTYFMCKQLGYHTLVATRVLVRVGYVALYAHWFMGPVTFGFILADTVCEGCSAFEGSFVGELRPLFIALVVLNLLMAIGTLVWIGNMRQKARETRRRNEQGLEVEEEPYLLRPVYVLPFPLTILWGAFMMAAFFNSV